METELKLYKYVISFFTAFSFVNFPLNTSKTSFLSPHVIFIKVTYNSGAHREKMLKRILIKKLLVFEK